MKLSERNTGAGRESLTICFSVSRNDIKFWSTTPVRSQVFETRQKI